MFAVRRNTRLISTHLACITAIIFATIASLLATPAFAFTQNPATVFINEIHYDNVGVDLGEFVEIAGPAGTNLSGWSIVRYNGTNPASGIVYTSPATNENLSGTIPDIGGSGYGVVVVNYPQDGLQNGPNDGIALVNDGVLVQFLSYEGPVVGGNGIASGVTSTDIGVSQTNSTPLDTSLQLTGTGNTYQDFSWTGPALGSPGALTSGQSFGGTPVDTAPSVSSTTPANSATDVAVDANITVTFSEPVTVSGSWFTIICTSGARTATVSGGPTSYTLDPDTNFNQSDSCTLTIIAAQVSDQDTSDPPDTMAADYSASFGVVAPPTILPIGEVQGVVGPSANGMTHRSPYAPASGNGSSSDFVLVQGVIYEKTLARTSAGAIQYGFFIQNTAATADSDPNTSDGIFVFMNTFSSLIGGYIPQVGDEVVLRARVGEFFSMSQLSSASLVQLVRSGVNLDAELPGFDVNPPDDLAEANRYWERHEGMRATIPTGSVVVDSRDVFPSTADAEIWVIRGDHPVAQRANPYARRVFRDFHPLDNNPGQVFDDGNGYRIILGSRGVKAVANDSFLLLAPARTYDTVNNALTGGVYFDFSKYQIQVTEQPALVQGVDPALNSPPQAFNRFREYSVAPYNVENLYDYRDDPFDGCDFAGNTGCPGVSPPFDYVPASDAAYQARLGDFATQIINDLHSPDILLIAEAEDQDICAVVAGALDCGATNNRDGKPDTLQELALRIAALGGPAYDAAYDRDGSDDRGIVAGFLYRTDRVELLPATAGDPVLGSSPTVSYRGTPLAYNTDVQNPKALNADLPDDVNTSTGVDGSNVFTRDPQVGLFRIWRDGVGLGDSATVWVLANHFSSTPDARVGQRREQAAYNAAIVAAIQAADANAKIVVGGDLNVYPRPDDPFAPGNPNYPSDQLGPLYDQGLVNLFDVVLAEDPDAAYGYIYQGQTQTIDHIFVTPNLQAELVDVREAHVNADFPADYDGDGARGLSDHDPQVARFTLDVTPPVTTASVSGTVKPGCPADCFYGSATVTLSVNEPATTQYRINGGPSQTYSGPFVITSEGANLVEFFSVDQAGNVESVKSITVKVTTFPSTGVIDSFNRANGRLGNNWSGATQADQYVISGQRVDVGKGGLALWQPASFGTSQEAYMTLSQIDAAGRHHTLVLKARGTNASQGAILVSYNAVQQLIIVEALAPGQGWRTVASFPATLANGSVLGARALADGSVHVYVNCMRVGIADTTTLTGNTYVNQGGRIGVWFENTANAIFDGFGGGNTVP